MMLRILTKSKISRITKRVLHVTKKRIKKLKF